MKAWFRQTKTPLDAEALRQEGVWVDALPLDPSAYQPRLDVLREARGYVAQDEVQLDPSMPNLDDICKKFDDEHLHDDDEVRFVLEGSGIFDIRSRDDVWMRVVVEPGDLIVVPKDRHHRFELTEARTIRCVRLFRDQQGWVPHYRAQQNA